MLAINSAFLQIGGVTGVEVDEMGTNDRLLLRVSHVNLLATLVEHAHALLTPVLTLVIDRSEVSGRNTMPRHRLVSVSRAGVEEGLRGVLVDAIRLRGFLTLLTVVSITLGVLDLPTQH